MIFVTPTAVNLLGFKVNLIDNASVMNFGPLQYIDQLVTYKRNIGFGEIIGDLSPPRATLSITIDPDLNDAQAIKVSAL